MARIIIIGGGIGGLACAWRLQTLAQAQGRDLQISLLEAGDRWGGVIESSQRDGFTLEHGPDSIIRSKPAGLRLIEELGLGDEVQGTNPQMSGSLIAKGTRLLPIPEGLYLMAPSRMLPFVCSSIVSWRGKLRMAMDLILPRRKADPDTTEESLADFVRRRLGREALERIAQPLVGGIYTADPEQLSLAHCMPQFIEMEREHRSLILAMRKRRQAMTAQGRRPQQVSGARYGLFLSLRGGLQGLTDRLVAGLDEVDMQLGRRVAALHRQDGCYRCTLVDGSERQADAVVLAMQAQPAGTICRSLDAELADELDAIPYASVATINIAFDRAAAGQFPQAAGFVVPAVEQRRLIACTFATTKYENRGPDDGVLLRAFVGGAMQEDQLQADDETMVERVLADLRLWFPQLPAPRWTSVHRWPKAMAQPHLGHGARVARIRAREATQPGLALIGNGYEGVGIPDIIAQADQAADRLLELTTT